MLIVATVLIAVVLYWLPSIIAVSRRVPHTGSVVVIDTLLGWTVIGWVVALAMACRSRPAPPYLLPPGWGPPPAVPPGSRDSSPVPWQGR